MPNGINLSQTMFVQWRVHQGHFTFSEHGLDELFEDFGNIIRTLHFS